MILTDDDLIAERCLGSRNLCFNEPEDAYERIGWNFRMTNIQAATTSLNSKSSTNPFHESVGLGEIQRTARERLHCNSSARDSLREERLLGLPGRIERLLSQKHLKQWPS